MHKLDNFSITLSQNNHNNIIIFVSGINSFPVDHCGFKLTFYYEGNIETVTRSGYLRVMGHRLLAVTTQQTTTATITTCIMTMNTFIDNRVEH